MTIASAISSIRSMSSLRSDTSSLGSRTFDSPRKRRDFPKRINPSKNAQKSHSNSSQRASPSRPPLSPHPEKGSNSSLDSFPMSLPSYPAKEQKGSHTVLSTPARTTRHASPPNKPPISSQSTTEKSSISTSQNKGIHLSSIQKNLIQKNEEYHSNSPASHQVIPGPRTRSRSPIEKKHLPRITESHSTQIESNSERTRGSSKSSVVSKSSSLSGQLQQHSSLKGRSTFHVRVSLGFMTGIKAEPTKKKKRNQGNSLLVGYALLEKSGKQIALSQPVVPKSGAKDSTPVKIVWANSKVGKEDVGSSKMKRRLSFSVHLGKEGDGDLNEDESTDGSTDPYEPEVVKLEVGLKCGETKFPLGIGNLVISGKEAKEQKVTLAVRPLNDAPTPNQRSRRGLFGSGKKQQEAAFVHGGYTYKLASNAALRVRVDVKDWRNNQSNTAAWVGGGDEASLATYWSYGTGASLSRGSVQQLDQKPFSSPSSVASQNSRKKVNRLPPAIRKQKPAENLSTPVSPIPLVSANTPTSQPPRNGSKRRLRMQDPNQIPVEYVVFRDSDMQSQTSVLTGPDVDIFVSILNQLCTPFEICGDFGPVADNGRYTRSRGGVIQSFSVDSDADAELPSWNGDKKPDSRDVSEMVRSDSRNPTHGDSKWKKMLLPGHIEHRQEGNLVTNVVVGDNNERSQPKIDRKQLLSESPTKKKASSAEEKEAASLDGGETVDISVGTFTDLKSAHSTLQRYATKVGIQMEDLLEEAGHMSKRDANRKNYQQDTVKAFVESKLDGRRTELT